LIIKSVLKRAFLLTNRQIVTLYVINSLNRYVGGENKEILTF
jgi:hypothetical protein